MISGLTGEEMPCDIYLGIVYYQRLRHMVSDKFQVSAHTQGRGWRGGTRLLSALRGRGADYEVWGMVAV
jgi:DNA-directed RNA polymerase beta subunit